jgi:hypothetical protein
VAVETEVTEMCETTDVTTMGDGAEVKTLKIRDCSDGTCQNEYMIEELQEQLAAAKARIAELEGQVADAPVYALERWYARTEAPRSGYPQEQMRDDIDAIEAWRLRVGL